MADAFAIIAGTALEYGLRMCAYLKHSVLTNVSRDHACIYCRIICNHSLRLNKVHNEIMTKKSLDYRNKYFHQKVRVLYLPSPGDESDTCIGWPGKYKHYDHHKGNLCQLPLSPDRLLLDQGWLSHLRPQLLNISEHLKKERSRLIHHQIQKSMQ